MRGKLGVIQRWETRAMMQVAIRGRRLLGQQSPIEYYKGNWRVHTEKLQQHVPTTTTSLSLYNPPHSLAHLTHSFSILHKPAEKRRHPPTMSTLTVPSQIPSVGEDCEQLRKAFAGDHLLFTIFFIEPIHVIVIFTFRWSDLSFLISWLWSDRIYAVIGVSMTV